MDGLLFLTGMQRSGTTLLEKLLCNHPELSMLSQPAPHLLVETKRLFYRHLGQPPPPFPLGHLFREERYRPADFAAWLDRFEVDGELVGRCFRQMENFTGWLSRQPPETLARFLAELEPGTLATVLAQLYRRLAHRPGASHHGAKEIQGEEVLPHLLAHGWRCVVILRDPRDVIASLNTGRGEHWGGAVKPTLFNVRNWRKSVAFALSLESHPGLRWLRYEDLVADTPGELDRLTRWLGVAPFPADTFAHGVRDQQGRLWRGNSSHDQRLDVSRGSLGAHRRRLPPEVTAFVEATCAPELAALGYPCAPPADARRTILDYRDPYPLLRRELADHAGDPRLLAQEVRRLEVLSGDPPAREEAQEWLLFAGLAERLRQAPAG